MKVLFISNLYPPNVVGGYEVLCCEVATEFARRGHEVTVLTSCYGGEESALPGQEIHQALRLVVGRTIYDGFSGPDHLRARLDEQNAAALNRIVEQNRPDAVFCWNLYGLGKRFGDALVETGQPVAVMLTDNWLASMMNPDFVGRYFRDYVYGSRLADPLPEPEFKAPQMPANISAIFGANFMRDFYAASDVRFARSVVVHNGVGLSPASETFHPPRAVLDGPVRLLFAGRVVEIKGAHTAVAALGLLARQHPQIDWRLSIVGDSRDAPYLDRLRALAEEAGCADRVAFADRVPAEELDGLFHSHDVYLFPSLYEPFSLTLIHALASSIPTVASTAGGNVEIVEDGVSGLLFPTGDAEGLARAVARLVEEPGLRERVARGGWSAARGFSSQRMFDQMEQHLDAIRKEPACSTA